MDLNLPVSDLAHGDRDRGGNDLRLTIRENGDDSRRDDRSANNLAVSNLSDRAGASASDDVDVDWAALGRPVAIVQVVERSGEALVENGRAAKSQRAVAANREARGEDCAGLSRSVELELEVGGNVSGTALAVGEDAVGESRNQDSVIGTTAALLLPVVSVRVKNIQGELHTSMGMAMSRFPSSTIATSNWPEMLPVQEGGADPVGEILSVTPPGTATARPMRPVANAVTRENFILSNCWLVSA